MEYVLRVPRKGGCTIQPCPNTREGSRMIVSDSRARRCAFVEVEVMIVIISIYTMRNDVKNGGSCEVELRVIES